MSFRLPRARYRGPSPSLEDVRRFNGGVRSRDPEVCDAKRMLGEPEVLIRRLFGRDVDPVQGRRMIEILTLLHEETPRTAPEPVRACAFA